jgi:acyl-CoA reductase-like NAD-dependent aldehyde dehydrogenase
MSITPSDSGDLTAATAACRARQAEWAALPARERLRPVRAFRRRLVADHAALCAAVAADLGKSAAETLWTEIIPLAEACRWLERFGPRALKPRRVPPIQRPVWLFGQRDLVYRRPHGLVGVIGTWNFPVFLNGVQILHALTAGNGVVWKPSEVAPATAAALATFLAEAGYPPGLLHVLPATRDHGRILAETGDVDHVVFTGHAATGRALATTLGRRLIPSTLELSGCDALFVCADADLAMAARAVWFGATINAGQTCLAVRRVFVDRAVYGPFLEALRPLAAAARPVRLAQAAAGKQAADLIAQALQQGARLLAEPPQAEGETGFGPAVVADVRPDMALCREAIFAPVAAVLPFDRLDDALAAQAQCPYGLGASVFTADARVGLRVAARLRVGMVSVNDVVAPTAHPGTPFGGRGASGWGVTQGPEGLREMTVAQVVSVRAGAMRPHYDPPGTTPLTRQETLAELLRFQYGGGLRYRSGAAWRLIQQALRTLVPQAWRRWFG